MGIKPSDFWQLTMWEWWAAFEAYCQFNGIEFKEGITKNEAKELAQKYAQI